jgi:hypothetical protein
MKNILITKKLKNKRVILYFNVQKNVFVMQFKRLKENNEVIDITTENCTAQVEILRNKIIITSIQISFEAGECLYKNFYAIFSRINTQKFIENEK